MAKEQEQLHRGRVLGDLAQIAAPGLVSRVARAVAGTKLFDRVRPPFNVMVSGVKGPDFSLFCAGSRVVALYPVGPLAEGVGLNVTIFSYLDQLHFGLLACRKLLPELEDLATAVDDALGELVGYALDARGGRQRSWRQTGDPRPGAGLAIAEVPVRDPPKGPVALTQGGGRWRRSICASWWRGRRALRPVAAGGLARSTMSAIARWRLYSWSAPAKIGRR